MIHVPNVNQTIFQIVREIRISEGLAESVDECAQRKRAGGSLRSLSNRVRDEIEFIAGATQLFWRRYGNLWDCSSYVALYCWCLRQCEPPNSRKFDPGVSAGVFRADCG